MREQKILSRLRIGLPTMFRGQPQSQHHTLMAQRLGAIIKIKTKQSHLRLCRENNRVVITMGYGMSEKRETPS